MILVSREGREREGDRGEERTGTFLQKLGVGRHWLAKVIICLVCFIKNTLDTKRHSHTSLNRLRHF